jgi:tetratricopeptide (TPR) repeat protein
LLLTPYCQAKSRRVLGENYLYQGKLKDARDLLEAAGKYENTFNNYRLLTVLGIVDLLRSDISAARQAFKSAIEKVENLLINNPQLYEANDNRGLALCGMVLCGSTDLIDDAKQAFKSARGINPYPGTVKMVDRIISTMAKADVAGILHQLRPFAMGEKLE